ncbi:MAG TPA: hypothetical protein PK156_23185 [Polyangium sp.]|nr:hypothetical protein [Polyangium sp.]
MKHHFTSFRMLALFFVGTVGCSDADVPLEAVGQFDPGTFEICLINTNCEGKNLIGAIYAYKVTNADGTINYVDSYEYWKINPAAMGCSSTATDTGTYETCNLAGKTIKPSSIDYSGRFTDWKKAYSMTIDNSIYLRATYVAHSGANDFNCSKQGGGSVACTYSPSTANATTNISPFELGTYSVGNKFVVTAKNANNELVETWYMDAFFNQKNIPSAGVSFGTSSPCGLFDCNSCGTGNCTRSPTSKIQVDVSYVKCTNAPTDTKGCG